MSYSRAVFGLMFSVIAFVSPAIAEEVRISSPFNVLEYNTVSKQYGERATFIKMNLRDKGDMGWIQADLIRKTDNAYLMGGYDVLRIKEKHVDKYIVAVEKYLSWQEIAVRDGDVFNKEIAQANKVKFSFHSGNSKTLPCC